jgi:ABC-type siderophore export system fused ATPase/permease subunit
MYHLLQPDIQPQPPVGSGIVGVLQWGMRTTIILAGLLAFVYLIVIGFQYMLTDNISNKSFLRKRILEVLMGLILAIGSYAILSFINPTILNLGFFSR